MPLTPREREMLEFTMLSWEFEGNRESAIRDRFDLSRTSFDLAVRRLIRRPEAESEMPVAVHRLQRLLESKQRSRSVPRLDVDEP